MREHIDVRSCNILLVIMSVHQSAGTFIQRVINNKVLALSPGGLQYMLPLGHINLKYNDSEQYTLPLSAIYLFTLSCCLTLSGRQHIINNYEPKYG